MIFDVTYHHVCKFVNKFSIADTTNNIYSELWTTKQTNNIAYSCECDKQMFAEGKNFLIFAFYNPHFSTKSARHLILVLRIAKARNIHDGVYILKTPDQVRPCLRHTKHSVSLPAGGNLEKPWSLWQVTHELCLAYGSILIKLDFKPEVQVIFVVLVVHIPPASDSMLRTGWFHSTRQYTLPKVKRKYYVWLKGRA